MVNRRNSRKAEANTAAANVAAEAPQYPDPRLALWYADDNKTYASSGKLTVTLEQAEYLLNVVQEFGEKNDRTGQVEVQFPVFLYANDNEGSRGPDESGGVKVSMVVNDNA